ncbi:MAG: restriction endonuclease subunit S [Rikenellaceae bacterium]
MITTRIKISEAFAGRLDPQQFHPERMDMLHHIQARTKYCKLKDVVKNVKTTTTVFNNDDIYIGLENITSHTGDYLPTNDKTSISSAAVFVRGNILFPKLRPYLNKVYRAEFDGKCSTEFHVFEAVDIDPNYLIIVLRSDIVLAQTKHLMTGNTLPRLQTSDVENLIIPYPDVAIQQKIVAIYKKAQDAKQTKDAEAKALLASIDSEILEQLGISIPKATERRLSFNVGVSDIIGKRMDVSFYKDRFELISTLYPNKKLSDVVIVNPSVSYKPLSTSDEISFLPMEVIDEKMGEIAEYRTTTVAETKGFTKFEDDDLLWAKITPCMQNGKSAIARNLLNGVGCGSTEFYVLRPKDATISIDYIYCLLRHHKVLEAAKSSFGGSAGQQRVSSNYLKSISIPVPPIEVQREIAASIHSKKAKAKQLQQEGAELLKEAKEHIERIILG